MPRCSRSSAPPANSIAPAEFSVPPWLVSRRRWSRWASAAAKRSRRARPPSAAASVASSHAASRTYAGARRPRSSPDGSAKPKRSARGRGAHSRMAEAKLDVAGCGSMVVDLFYRTPKFIRAEQKIALDAHHGDGRMERAAVGGLILNHLGWARVLGLEVGVFGKIGADRHGEFLRRGIGQLGIRHHLTSDGSASSFAKIFVDARGGRAIYMARGATAELAPDEIRRRHAGFIRHARMISTEVSQLPLRTVIALLLFARANSIPTVLDVDLPPVDACPILGTRAELERALRLATILKPTRSAARALVRGTRDTLKLAQAMRARYQSQAVVVTDGERGCAIAAPD